MFENVSVIGGDLRQLTVAKLLKAEGYHVFLYGFDKDIQLETLECETAVSYTHLDVYKRQVQVLFLILKQQEWLSWQVQTLS